MNLPFTVEQFFSVFEAYNKAIRPAHVAAYGLGAAAVLLAVCRSVLSDRIVSAILAAFWLWTGIAYHITHFSGINKAAYAFGVLFIIEGLLLLVFGAIRPRLSFRFRPGVWSLLGAALILYSLIVYPGLGLLLGHPAAEIPWFGVTPCPRTIFTFGLLLWASGSRLIVLVIPLLWSIVGGSAALLQQVPQDYGLLVGGLIGFVSLFRCPGQARPPA